METSLDLVKMLGLAMTVYDAPKPILCQIYELIMQGSKGLSSLKELTENQRRFLLIAACASTRDLFNPVGVDEKPKK